MPANERSSASPASTEEIRSYQRKLAEGAAISPGVATDPAVELPPPRTPIAAAAAQTASGCEPHRAFIKEQLRLRRNATAIYQDLVDQHGFTGAYNGVKRFVAKVRQREPEQFDRLSFLPGEEMQVDYGEGALTRVPGTDRWRKPRLFVATLEDTTLPAEGEALLGKIDHALENVEECEHPARHLQARCRAVGANLQSVPLPPLMEALHDEVAPLAQRKGVAFTLLPCSLTVCSDPQLLRRLLQNFLTNAVRYTHAGRILFGARRRGDKVELQVADTGIGMAAQDIPKALEPFGQISGPMSRRHQGTGLGLDTAWRIVTEEHGGTITVASEPGRTVFRVTLPLTGAASE